MSEEHAALQKSVADQVTRVAKLEARVASLENPTTRELLGYRWKELKELVEFLSVVGQVDVLANILTSMRQSKKAAEEAITAGNAAKDAEDEKASD